MKPTITKAGDGWYVASDHGAFKHDSWGQARDTAMKMTQGPNLGLSSSHANDAFRNSAARMGMGTNSLPEATEYPLTRISNNYMLMLALFRNHWISRRIVEGPAQDMVRAWPRLTSDLKPEDIKRVDRAIDRTGTKSKVLKALKDGRLFGGAGALMVIDGHEDILDEPLDLDDVNPGSYRGLIPFHRWSGIYPEGSICTDITKPLLFGLPETYRVNVPGGGKSFEVHASRILRFIGCDVPQPEYQAQNYWGISVLEPAFEEIRKRDNLSWSILNLTFRANILAQTNPELAQALSGLGMSSKALEQFYGRMEAQNELLSNQGMVILPKDGKMESFQYSFSGLADVYQQFQLDIAGAAQYPVVRLFGRTISGLGQANDADERIYEERIAQAQHQELEPQLDTLYQVVCMSELGEVPDDLDLDFPSVRVLTEEEKSNLAKETSACVLEVFNTGAISEQTMLRELQQSSKITGIFTNIRDEDIKKASDQTGPPDFGELPDLPVPKPSLKSAA
jgi:phage-related protein (TIGR01555 family)